MERKAAAETGERVLKGSSQRKKDVFGGEGGGGGGHWERQWREAKRVNEQAH